MRYRSLIPIISCCLSMIAAVPLAIAGRPNIVIILADDLGAVDLGCYGADLHETPRLASMVIRIRSDLRWAA